MTQAWQYKDGVFSSADLADRELRESEVRIEVEATALTRHDLLAAGDKSEYIPGQAAVGRVIEAGTAATEWLSQRVVVGPSQACGECELCRRALVEHCLNGSILGESAPGTLARHVTAQARWLCRLDDQLALPSEAAALVAGPAGLAYSAFAKAGIGAGEPVVIVGEGATAVFLEQVAVSRGAPAVKFAPDIPLPSMRANIDRLRRAHDLGASPFTLFETTETEEGRNLAVDLAEPGTALVMTVRGGTDPADSVDVAQALENTLTLICVRNAHPDLFPEVAALATREELQLDPQIVRVGLDQLDALPGLVQQELATGQVPLIVISPES